MIPATPSTPSGTTPRAARAFDGTCLCTGLDRDALARALDSELGRPGLSALVRERCPFVFAAPPVFVATRQLERMARVVRAVESVVALPAYRDEALSSAPAAARLGPPGPLGAFFGYDFHPGEDGPRLIEINTNAGGAMLNAVLARAQRACCAAAASAGAAATGAHEFERRIVAMFEREWRLADLHGDGRALASVAIVDDSPQGQYLYPEFVLFRELFERHGLRAVVADPAALEWRDGALRHEDLVIDLVYHRSTDFYLEGASSAALLEAHARRAVVLTPHPRAHALYADKRRLALFGDADRLTDLGVLAAVRDILVEHVPRTETVEPVHAERLWRARRGLFFKPVAGFGSRAAYRGDKLTRRVWHEILAGDYVAQAIVAPGRWSVGVAAPDDGDATQTPMKFDLRAYAYDGEVQRVAARLYRGQTTNFRTPGGGFAPVYALADVSGRPEVTCACNRVATDAAAAR